MKMNASAASENATDRSVKYERMLPGMWSMKIRNSERPRKKSSRRSRVGRAAGAAMIAGNPSSGLRRGHAHQLLAAVLAFQHSHERTRRRCDTLGHVLLVFQPTIAKPLRDIATKLLGLVPPIPDQESLHARALDQELPVPPDAGVGRLQAVIDRDAADDDHTTVEREVRERRVVHVAADIIEEHVDPLGCERRELGAERVAVLALVVDCRIEAEDIPDIGDLVGRAGGADDVAALDLGDLAGDLPHR